MKWFFISPEDRTWMKRRLRRSFCCFLILSAFHLIKHDHHHQAVPSDRLMAETWTDSAEDSTGVAPDSPTFATGPLDSSERSNFISPDENSDDLEQAIQNAAIAKAVPPTGWRRTNRGWERVDDWSRQYPQLYVQPRSLQDWMDLHREQQPSWLQSAMNRLSQMPPLSIAGLQMLAIFVIARQSSRRPRTEATPVTQSVSA